MIKASLPKGTRDFLPLQLLKRKYLFDIIESVFKSHAYSAIETPAMESLSSLTGQYGDEGDKLLFKILNNGDFLAKADSEAIDSKDSNALIASISKRGLRYDLTVPFARFVVMHQNELSFPFKRYAIQPVWRADRPQKGRYQEFYQCDADVVGSDSLLYEAELVSIYDLVFKKLGLDVVIKVNNRKLLQGIAIKAGIGDRFASCAVGIDKLDKIGIDGVKKEFIHLGFPDASVNVLFSLLDIKNLGELQQELADIPIALEGIGELQEFHSYLDQIETHNEVSLDLTLARGLGYYTGTIFEVKAKGSEMGSIGGGGRYANLTEIFGMSGNSGVGISFGAERIYDVMEEKGLFKTELLEQTLAVFLSFDKESLKSSFVTAFKLRNLGIAVDVYPEATKFKKQMKYASDKNYLYSIIIGEDERKSGSYTLKNMTSGEQRSVGFDLLVKTLKEK